MNSDIVFGHPVGQIGVLCEMCIIGLIGCGMGTWGDRKGKHHSSIDINFCYSDVFDINR